MYGGDNGGERGEKFSPHHGETEALSGPRSLSPESSNPSGESETPATLGGLMLVECCACGTSLPPVPVPVDDPANGKVSHGYCPPCERLALAEVQAMQVPIVAEGPIPPKDCEQCGVKLTADFQCPKCGVSHTERCGSCMRWGFHADGCAQSDATIDGYHNEAAPKAFLTSLGLWPLPGGVA